MYPNGDSTTEGVIDILPRMGRAVLFKSEALLHKVNPTLEWDNYSVTFYFN